MPCLPVFSDASDDFWIYGRAGKVRVELQAGDSLTTGTMANNTSNGGYRLLEHDWVTAEGYLTRNIGSVIGPGAWSNNQNEGHPGFTVEGIRIQLNSVYPAKIGKADLIYLLAGTNNANGNGGPYVGATVAQDLEDLGRSLLAVSYRTLLVMMTIPPQRDSPGSANAADLNSRIPAIVATLSAENVARGGPPVLLADLFAALGSAWSSTYFSGNGTHMNQAGYDKCWDEIQATVTAAGYVQP